MFKTFLAIAAILSLTWPAYNDAHCQDLKPSLPVPAASHAQRPDERQRALDLLSEIVVWLSSNYDLPAIKELPTIEFESNIRLAMRRAADGAPSPVGENDFNELGQRQVVALYDNISKTILLSDEWTGTSTADQSVLVHEMVHHLQNLAGLKFECPSAREKMAYLAQAKWLERFGLNLEHEFDVDLFTVVVSSACLS